MDGQLMNCLQVMVMTYDDQLMIPIPPNGRLSPYYGLHNVLLLLAMMLLMMNLLLLLLWVHQEQLVLLLLLMMLVHRQLQRLHRNICLIAQIDWKTTTTNTNSIISRKQQTIMRYEELPESSGYLCGGMTSSNQRIFH
jgi:hypothetical protein